MPNSLKLNGLPSASAKTNGSPRLYGAAGAHGDRKRELVKEVQRDTAVRALRLGIDVVLDWGLWGRSERDDVRARAAALGVTFELLYLDVPRDELWRCIQARNAALPPDTYFVDDALLDACWQMFQPPTADEIT